MEVKNAPLLEASRGSWKKGGARSQGGYKGARSVRAVSLRGEESVEEESVEQSVGVEQSSLGSESVSWWRSWRGSIEGRPTKSP